jgi:hypothetical protein
MSTVILSTTTTATGTPVGSVRPAISFQASGLVTASTGSATVVIEASNEGDAPLENWLAVGTITLSLTTSRSSDGFAATNAFNSYRARVSAISGTNASVTVSANI